MLGEKEMMIHIIQSNMLKEKRLVGRPRKRQKDQIRNDVENSRPGEIGKS